MELRKRKTLLDLDRLPTQKELREFFISNDWTTRKPYDFDKLFDIGVLHLRCDKS